LRTLRVSVTARKKKKKQKKKKVHLANMTCPGRVTTRRARFLKMVTEFIAGPTTLAFVIQWCCSR
jgi:hypothetical protein